MKTILILFLAANSLLKVMGQTDSLAVIVSSGTFAPGKAVRVNLVVGESMTENKEKANVLLLQDNQGMLEPAYAILNESFEDAGVKVFPTKTPDIVNVVISQSVKADLTGDFIDKGGKSVRHVVLDALHNEINIKDLNDGVYLLRISTVNIRVTEATIVKDKSLQP